MARWVIRNDGFLPTPCGAAADSTRTEHPSPSMIVCLTPATWHGDSLITRQESSPVTAKDHWNLNDPSQTDRSREFSYPCRMLDGNVRRSGAQSGSYATPKTYPVHSHIR
ncbi:hypothetical protein AX17_000063 [Amanita inopinata Kibby_2008]|nr:hypothetical protein AX17_000063 [Amanita inopinata Kibby_2008]